jgi:hypothetical protein
LTLTLSSSGVGPVKAHFASAAVFDVIFAHIHLVNG